MEAVYFKKPIVINTYSIYSVDIKPKGFQLIEMNEYVTEDTVNKVIDCLKNKKRAEKMAGHNDSLARRFYSYANLKRKLKFVLADFFGEE